MRGTVAETKGERSHITPLGPPMQLGWNDVEVGSELSMIDQRPATNDRSARRRTSLRWLFENRETGRITVAQMPNLPLAIFLAAAGLRMLLHPRHAFGVAVSIIATGALLWWALGEVARGVNPFRRILGGLVFAATVIGLLMR